MTKKIKIIVSIIFVIILIMGGYLGWEWRKESKLGLIEFEEFNIKETEAEKVIRNKEVGLAMKVSKDWQVGNGVGGYNVELISPGAQANPELSHPYFVVPQKGCLIEVGVRKEKENTSYDMEYSHIKGIIKDCIEVPGFLEESGGFYQLVEVNGYKGLKMTNPGIKDQQLIFTYIEIKVPKNEKVYTFNTVLAGEDQEKCESEFDKFLETVSIE